MKLAEADFDAVIKTLYPHLVHPDRAEDAALKGLFTDMARSLGGDAFLRH
jgi:hypothetical protein